MLLQTGLNLKALCWRMQKTTSQNLSAILSPPPRNTKTEAAQDEDTDLDLLVALNPALHPRPDRDLLPGKGWS